MGTQIKQKSIQGYQLLIPSNDYDLELKVKLRYYSTLRVKNLYFSGGTYTPEIIEDSINNLEETESYLVGYPVRCTILNHKYTPVLKAPVNAVNYAFTIGGRHE